MKFLAKRVRFRSSVRSASCEGGLRLFHIGFGGLQIGPGLRHLRLGKRRIDLGQQLPFLDRGIVIHEDLLDRSRNLGSHQNGRHRAHRSRGGHRGAQIPPGHLCRLELDPVSLVLEQVKSAQLPERPTKTTATNIFFFMVLPPPFPGSPAPVYNRKGLKFGPFSHCLPPRGHRSPRWGCPPPRRSGRWPDPGSPRPDGR